jgi:hypothetical protein
MDGQRRALEVGGGREGLPPRRPTSQRLESAELDGEGRGRGQPIERHDRLVSQSDLLGVGSEDVDLVRRASVPPEAVPKPDRMPKEDLEEAGMRAQSPQQEIGACLEGREQVADGRLHVLIPRLDRLDQVDEVELRREPSGRSISLTSSRRYGLRSVPKALRSWYWLTCSA